MINLNLVAFLLCCAIVNVLVAIAYKHEGQGALLRHMLRSAVVAICIHYVFFIAGWLA